MEKHIISPTTALLGAGALAAVAIVATRRSLRNQIVTQSETLLHEARRQAQPRRWPWQAKTARDRLNERGAELATVAAEQSKQLATVAADQGKHLAAAAADQGKKLVAKGDGMLQEVRKQSQPRRWPWQAKTVRDRLNERSVELAAVATEQGKKLVAKSDDILHEARRQAQPRRWPWQAKTVRDRLNEQSSTLKSAAVDQLHSAVEETKRAAQVGGSAVLTGATLVANQAKHAAVNGMRSAPEQALPAIQEKAAHATDWIKTAGEQVGNTASATGEQIQHMIAAVPTAVESAVTTAADALKDKASSIGTAIGDSANAAASSARAVAHKPADMLSSKMDAGKRRVHYALALTKTALRWLIIGVAVGVLTSPRSGKELRRELRDTAVYVLDVVLQPN